MRAADVTPRIRRLLRLLSNHDKRDIKRVGYSPSDNRSSGAIFRGATTYEDLFYLCQQMSLWSNGLVDNSFVTTLMEIIERKARGPLAGGSIIARMSDLGSLADHGAMSMTRQKQKGDGSLFPEMKTVPFFWTRRGLYFLTQLPSAFSTIQPAWAFPIHCSAKIFWTLSI